ncbi:MAG: protein-disulfide reductase DsbD [Burkholderiaceae bacterium]
MTSSHFWRNLFAALLFLGVASASPAADDFLEPEQAFKFSAKKLDDKTLEVAFDVAPGYYMYREKFAFKAEGVKLGDAQIPPGKIKFDETFQKDVESHRGLVQIKLPAAAAGPFNLEVTSQGCADKGLCYPPMTSVAKIGAQLAVLQTASGEAAEKLLAAALASNVPAAAAASLPAATESTVAAGAVSAGAVASTRQTSAASGGATLSRIDTVLKERNLFAAIALFFGLGLLLTFTPCVLPMVPILSSIIVGEGKGITKMRGFSLSLAYVLGMALVYTGVGVVAGLIGEGLTAALQNPWVLGTFAILLVILSFSMFGYYELQLPAFLRDKLNDAQGKQQGGKFAGVFVMGALSAIIVGPCVSAPLAGILTFIAQTKDAAFGGTVLFAMAMGMGVPLLLVGIGAGSVLPRAGMWMESVKKFFGVLLVGTAIWMISPVIPAWLHMLLWALLLVGYAGFLLVKSEAGAWLPKTAGALFAALGLILLLGLASGGRDILAPLAHLTGGAAVAQAQGIKEQFVRVQTSAELDAKLAATGGKPVLLDFYADWCVSCKEMERFTFTDEKVAAKMREFVLLQVDVTANNAQDKALLKRFALFGPPGIIFFDPSGKEVQGGRVIGYQNAEKFYQSLSLIKS